MLWNSLVSEEKNSSHRGAAPATKELDQGLRRQRALAEGVGFREGDGLAELVPDGLVVDAHRLFRLRKRVIGGVQRALRDVLYPVYRFLEVRLRVRDGLAP